MAVEDKQVLAEEIASRNWRLLALFQSPEVLFKLYLLNSHPLVITQRNHTMTIPLWLVFLGFGKSSRMFICAKDFLWCHLCRRMSSKSYNRNPDLPSKLCRDIGSQQHRCSSRRLLTKPSGLQARLEESLLITRPNSSIDTAEYPLDCKYSKYCFWVSSSFCVPHCIVSVELSWSTTRTLTSCQQVWWNAAMKLCRSRKQWVSSCADGVTNYPQTWCDI